MPPLSKMHAPARALCIAPHLPTCWCSRIVSHRTARTLRCQVQSTSAPKVLDPWQKAQDMLYSGTVAEGVIKGYNKGGVIVELGDLKGFIPYTKLSPDRLKPGHKGDLSYLVGQTVRARVVQVDTQSKRKELVLSERQAALTEAIQKLQPGDTVAGEVVRLEDYGAIVTLTSLTDEQGTSLGVQGLIHKSELSWDTVMTVNDVLQTGQTVEVKVLDVDVSRCRVSLSLKQMQQDPLKETIDSLTWVESAGPLPEVQSIVRELGREAGINSIAVGLQAEVKHTVAQDLELYLTKEEEMDGILTVVARCGRMLQRLHITTSLSKDDMKKAITRVLIRVR
eukprot:jgi/Chrzof1/919/Cz01g33180.t1